MKVQFCFLSQIKETHQAVKDSESGMEKMKIGHHIKDKGHVVEKKYNKKTGEKELNQDFQNMDECMSNSCFLLYIFNIRSNLSSPLQLRHSLFMTSGSRRCPDFSRRTACLPWGNLLAVLPARQPSLVPSSPTGQYRDHVHMCTSGSNDKRAASTDKTCVLQVTQLSC